MKQLTEGFVSCKGKFEEDTHFIEYSCKHGWHALATQRIDSKEVVIDGWSGLEVVRETEVTAHILADLCRYAANLAGLSEEQYIIGTNGVKIRVWREGMGTYEQLAEKARPVDLWEMICD